jgi:hypothetical protein
LQLLDCTVDVLPKHDVKVVLVKALGHEPYEKEAVNGHSALLTQDLQ